MIRIRNTPPTGIVLLLTLAVLAMLSVLCIAFVSMARLERGIARNYVARSTAQFVAESGVEKAMAVISSWRGSDTELLAAMAATPDDPDLPLLQLPGPSFRVETLPALPGAVAASGFVGSGSFVPNGDFYKLRVRNNSGKLYLNDTNSVMDNGEGRLGSLIANLGDLLYGPGMGALIAAEILDARATAGGVFRNWDPVEEALLKAGLLPSQFKKFLDEVTLYAWQDKGVLRPHPVFTESGGGVDGSGFHQDPEVFDYPDPVAEHGLVYTNFPDYYGDDIYMYGEFQHHGLELEARAPIQINLASRELIQAVLTGIQGIYLYEYGHESFISVAENAHERQFASESGGMYLWSRSTYGGSPTIMNFPCHFGKQQTFGQDTRNWFWNTSTYPEWKTVFSRWDARYMYETRTATTNSPGLPHGSGSTLSCGSIRRTVKSDDYAQDLAKAMHLRIHTENKPFRCWQEFRDFLYDFFKCNGNFWNPWTHFRGDPTQDAARAGLEAKYLADAILANCCPNADLNDFNPSAVVFRHVDKNDLLSYTTEFSFQMNGFFEIECEGYVVDADGGLAGRHAVRCEAELFKTARISSQAQFFGPVAAEAVAAQEDYFGINTTPAPTQGAGDPPGSGSATISPISPYVGYNGTLTQSHPEALCFGDEGRLAASVFDGCVTLATSQSLDTIPGLTFRASFNGALDADWGLGSTTLFNTDALGSAPDDEEIQGTDRLCFTPDAANPDKIPGTLLSDGAYSEAYRTLMFHSRNNFGGAVMDSTGSSFAEGEENNLIAVDTHPRGTLAFWFKPNWQPERSTRVRQLFSISATNGLPGSQFNSLGCPDDRLSDHASDFSLYFIPHSAMTPAGGDSSTFYSSACLGPMVGDDKGAWGVGCDYDTSGFIRRVFQDHPNRCFVLEIGGGVYPFQLQGSGPRYKNAFIRVGTDCTNYLDFPRPPDTDNDGVWDSDNVFVYNVMAHRWTFAAIGWDFQNSSPSACLQINRGFSLTEPKYQHHDYAGAGIPHSVVSGQSRGFWYNAFSITTGAIYNNSGYPGSDANISPVSSESSMRFGEYARSMPNFAADGTFDEISCTSEYPGVTIPLSSFNDYYYEDGRFYNPTRYGVPATYTTRPLTLQSLAELSGDPSVRQAGTARLRTASWTLWWPDTVLLPDAPAFSTNPHVGTLHNRNPDRLDSADVNPNDATHAFFPDDANPVWEDINGPNMDPDIKPSKNMERANWDPITVDIQTAAGKWVFADADETQYPEYDKADVGATGISNSAGSNLSGLNGEPILISKGESSRLRFFFNVTTTTPLHESPVLDDITITFSLGKPSILRWEVIYE